MTPLINPIYVHSEVENQWYHLHNSRFENQMELLTKKLFWTNSIFAKTAALVGCLSGIGMIVGPVIKLAINKTDASDTNAATQILPIVGASLAFLSTVWASYQCYYCNRLRACRLTLNKDLDQLFQNYKGTANFSQIFTKVGGPRENSKFIFEVDRNGEIDRNEEGCCLVPLNQN